MDRQEVEQFIKQTFTNIDQDYPWENYPTYTIFRHTNSRKWFALIAQIHYSTFIPNQDGNVNFLNIKCDPDLIEDLIRRPGFFPAYHMNKKHWTTILLDHTAPADQIKTLIDLSYKLTLKHRWT